MMMMRGEPDYIDQVPRKLAWEAAHPDGEILYLGPYWQAILRDEAGQAIVTRTHLRDLMNKLESLDEEKKEPSSGQRQSPPSA